jgi:hypothetical protein
VDSVPKLCALDLDPQQSFRRFESGSDLFGVKLFASFNTWPNLMGRTDRILNDDPEGGTRVLIKSFRIHNLGLISVADPGSGGFLTPGSGMGK